VGPKYSIGLHWRPLSETQIGRAEFTCDVLSKIDNMPRLFPCFPTSAARRSKRFRFALRWQWAGFLLVFLATGVPAEAQWIGKQTGCYADSIVANPNRPTVANPADITQYGVLELEYGWDRTWSEENIRQTSLGGLLKFGLLCDVELRWNTISFLRQSGTVATIDGIGDNWIGPQVRVYKQTKRAPSVAISYAAKIPTANVQDGLGSGQVDDSIILLVSKDVEAVHFDFNFVHFWIGRQSAPGFDQNNQPDLAFSRRVHGPLQFTGEFYGATNLNKTTPSFVSSLWALSGTVCPRLVVDGGFEAGLTSGGPHRHAFFGATYSIGNLYSKLRRKDSSSAQGLRKVRQ
jgi:hypothetical protein